MLLGYGYVKNNLVYLGWYYTHRDVADMSDLFYFYSMFICQGGWRAYWISRSEMGEQKSI